MDDFFGMAQSYILVQYGRGAALEDIWVANIVSMLSRLQLEK